MGTRLLCSGALTMQQGMAWAALLATCKAPVRSCINVCRVLCRTLNAGTGSACATRNVSKPMWVDVAERLLEALAAEGQQQEEQNEREMSHSL